MQVLVLLESVTVVYGIPVDFLASWHQGWPGSQALCTATGYTDFIGLILALLLIKI